MKTITVNGTEYKIKYGFNSFADTDLLERVGQIVADFGESEESPSTQFGNMRNMFDVTRELLFVGFQKYNPVETVLEVGDLLDEYHDECPEGESRGLIDIFTILVEELTEEGFFKDMMESATQIQTPSDHKKPTTRKATKK